MHAHEPVWQTARSQLVHELNQLVRRLRQYRTESEWAAALLDGALHFVHQVAVFAFENGTVRLLGQRNLDLRPGFSFPSASAAAFTAAIQSRDPVIAVRSPSEVTGILAVADDGARAHVLPIVNGSRVVAVLFAAADGYVDVNALELVTGMASMVLERQANAFLHAQVTNNSR